MMNRLKYHREYRKKNKEKLREYQKEYRINNKAKIKYWQRKWLLNNLEKRREITKKYNATPQGIYMALKRGCYHRNVLFNWERDKFIRWYEKQKRECFYCGISEDKSMETNWTKRFNRLCFDKVIPSKGYSESNVVLCCQRCNLIKNDFFTKEEMLEIAEKYIKPRL